MTQFIRYFLVGMLSNLIIYLVYLVATYLGVEPKLAMTLVYIVGAFLGFIGNRKWTFAHQGKLSQAALRYMCAHLVGYLINLMILIEFVDRRGYPHQIVQAAAIFVVAVLLFVMFKHFVFAAQRRTPDKS